MATSSARPSGTGYEQSPPDSGLNPLLVAFGIGFLLPRSDLDTGGHQLRFIVEAAKAGDLPTDNHIVIGTRLILDGEFCFLVVRFFWSCALARVSMINTPVNHAIKYFMRIEFPNDANHRAGEGTSP